MTKPISGKNFLRVECELGRIPERAASDADEESKGDWIHQALGAAKALANVSRRSDLIKGLSESTVTDYNGDEEQSKLAVARVFRQQLESGSEPVRLSAHPNKRHVPGWHAQDDDF